MEKNEKPIINKIEVDQKTNEPIIVKAKKRDIFAAELKALETDVEEPIVNEPINSEGEQLIMNKVLGFVPKKQQESAVAKRQRIFKNVCVWLFVVLMVGVLAYTAYHDFFSGKEIPSWEYIFSTLSKNWYYLVFAILSILLCYVFKGTKLSVMCKSLTKKWHYKACIGTGAIGLYYNYVTPLAAGGQPFEIYHLSKNGVKGGVAGSLPIASFFLHQVAFLVLGVVSIVLYSSNVLSIPSEMIGHMPKIITPLAIIGLSFSILMPTLVLIFCIFPKLASAIVLLVMNLGNKLRLVKRPKTTTRKTLKAVKQNAQCLKDIAKSPFTLIASVLLSFAEQLALCSIAYFSLKFFGFDWPARNITEWIQVLSLCFILYSAISFIPTPGNSGAADLSFYLLFDTGLMIGTTKIGALAFPAMITWRILSFYSFVIIGFIYTSVNRRKAKSESKNA